LRYQMIRLPANPRLRPQAKRPLIRGGVPQGGVAEHDLIVEKANVSFDPICQVHMDPTDG